MQVSAFDRNSPSRLPWRYMESFEFERKKRGWRKIILIILGLVLAALITTGLYFGWKIHTVGKKINVSISNENKKSFVHDVSSVVTSVISPKLKALRGEDEGRINILLLGLSGGNRPGKNLTDTIMIMSVDTKEKKVALLSLPRDLYVSIPGSDYSTKINTIYQHGIQNNEDAEPIRKTVEEITGLPMHYFLILDFDGFEKIIDDIGGINVMVERDIYDPRYPGPNFSYETFEIKKGLAHMDGKTALKYARERHNDPEGDFGRAKRQQVVIQAAKNRVFSLKTFLNVVTLNNLLNTLERHIKTDIAIDDIESFIALSKAVDSQNITNVVADAWNRDSLLKVSHVYAGGVMMFILVPQVGSWSEVQDLAQNIFDLDIIKKRKAEIENEKASIAIVNQSTANDLGNKIRDLLEDRLQMKDISLVYYQVKPSRAQTVVVDNTSGKKLYTLDELIKKLPARPGSANSDIMKMDKNYDFVVLLGNDLVEKYSFEEDSIEEWKKHEDDQNQN
jgi:LCP family protein required for cell wall assembly